MSEQIIVRALEEEDYLEITCSNCEVEYIMILEDDFLEMSAVYCSFCGEVLERE